MSEQRGVARVVSLVMRVRWQVAFRVARRILQELQTAQGRLEPEERRRLGELLRVSGGRLMRLSPQQRTEVARLAQKAAGLRT